MDRPARPGPRSRELVQPPSAEHWFGTTHLGQDIFSQVLVGTRGVMIVGFLAGAVATLLSVLIGVTAGYVGGGRGESLSALSNVFLVIPALPLVIIVASTMPEVGDVLIALVIGLTSWAWGARVLRAQTLSLRRRDYVEAARASGESTWRIIVFEILPNLTAVIASGFVGTVIFAVMSEITLAFIGISSVTVELGRDPVLGPEPAGPRAGRLVVVRAGRSGHRPARHGAVADQLRHRRVRQPPPAQQRPDQDPDHGRRRVRMRVGFTPSSAPAHRVAGRRSRAAVVTSTARSGPHDQSRRRPVLEIRDLNVDYGLGDKAVRAVRDVNLTLHRGEVLGLAGESGSGKSTLAYGITRLLPPPGVMAGGQVLYHAPNGDTSTSWHGPGRSAGVPVGRDLDRVPGRDELAQPGAQGLHAVDRRDRRA